MGMGITGAIDPDGKGDLSAHYAISVTYLVHPEWSNKIVANCKRCGRKLEKGEGTRTMISQWGPRPTEAYFCWDCVEWVEASVRAVMDRKAKDSQAGQPENVGG